MHCKIELIFHFIFPKIWTGCRKSNSNAQNNLKMQVNIRSKNVSK